MCQRQCWMYGGRRTRDSSRDRLTKCRARSAHPSTDPALRELTANAFVKEPARRARNYRGNLSRGSATEAGGNISPSPSVTAFHGEWRNSRDDLEAGSEQGGSKSALSDTAKTVQPPCSLHQRQANRDLSLLLHVLAAGSIRAEDPDDFSPHQLHRPTGREGERNTLTVRAFLTTCAP